MSYSDQLQRIVEKYIVDGNRWPATLAEISKWAIDRNMWEPQRTDNIKLLSRQISQAMREERFTGLQGRLVRAKHAFRKERDGKSEYLWTAIRLGSRKEIQRSLQQRRQHIVGQCRQLKTDVDSYNENLNPGEPFR